MLISIPSCHIEEFSGEVQQKKSIYIYQHMIRIMASTKSKSSVRNYVHVWCYSTYQQKLSVLPSVVGSIEKMEKIWLSSHIHNIHKWYKHDLFVPNPNMNKEQQDVLYRNIAIKYLPHTRSYDGSNTLC